MNSREIKFRIWDPEHAEIMPIEAVAWTTEMVGALAHTESESPVEEPHVHPWELLMLLFDNTSTVMMQYTGLKDQNGVEIYEGDIIDIAGVRAQVKFEHGAWRYEGEDLTGYLDDCCEAIGNIYENPDLI